MPILPPLSQNNSDQSDFHSFSHLADYLDARREAILLLWRTVIENDHRMGVASKLGRVAFEDNIPATLAFLIQQLHREQQIDREQVIFSGGIAHNLSKEGSTGAKSEDSENEENGQAHGFHRWQEGYDLRQLMMETGHLNQTMVGVLNQYEIDYPNVLREVMNRSRVLVSQLLDACYFHSVNEYHRLQEAEATEIVHSLSQALETMGKWEQARGDVLRESVHDLRGNLSAIQGASNLLEGLAGDTAVDTTTPTGSTRNSATKYPLALWRC